MNVLLFRYSRYWSTVILDRADDVYLVVEEGANAELPPEVLARVSRLYRVASFDSLEELSAIAADLISEGVRVDRVVSANEQSQYAAGYLSQLLNLTDVTPALALNTRDKRRIKSLAQAAGLDVARGYSLPDAGRDADLAALEHAVGYPMVLKPANGCGAVSVTKVHDRDELAVVLKDYQFADELRSRQLLAEEFVDGEEFHIDAVWRDGLPWVFCVSRYLEPVLAWLDNGQDGSVMLPESEHAEFYARLRALHDTLNAALGITRGATHLEVLVERGTGRLVVTEIASRQGGAVITDVIGARWGIPGREIWAHELFDGRLEDLSFTESRLPYVGWVNIRPPRSGRITRIADAATLRAREGVLDATVLFAAGDEFNLANSTAWCSLVLLEARSEQDLLRLVTDLLRDFEVQVT